MSKNSGIVIPFGWERRIDASNSIVTYVSPTGVVLSSIAAVCQYLENNNTCKCGLQCPLHVPKIFNFNPNVRSINMTKNEWSLHENKTESHKKNCQHWNKLQKTVIVKKKVPSNAEVSSEPPPKLIIIRKDGQLTSVIPDNKKSAVTSVKKEEKKLTIKKSLTDSGTTLSRSNSAISPLKSPLFENAARSATKTENSADASKTDFKLQWIKADDELSHNDSESGNELCFSPDFKKSPPMSFPQLTSPTSTLFNKHQDTRPMFMHNTNAPSMGLPSMHMGVEPVHRFGMSAFPGTNFVSKSEVPPRYSAQQQLPRYSYMNVKSEQDTQHSMSFSAPANRPRFFQHKGFTRQDMFSNEQPNMSNWPQNQQNIVNFQSGQPRHTSMDWQRSLPTPGNLQTLGSSAVMRPRGATLNSPPMRQAGTQQFPMGSPPSCHSASPFNHPVGTPGINAPLCSPGSRTDPSPYSNRPNSRSSSMGTPTPSPLPPHGTWQGQRMGYNSDNSRPHSRSSSIPTPKQDPGAIPMQQWNTRPTNPASFHSRPPSTIGSGSELSPSPLSPFSPTQKLPQNVVPSKMPQSMRPQGGLPQGFNQNRLMNPQQNFSHQSQQQHFRGNAISDMHQQFHRQPGMQTNQFNVQLQDTQRFTGSAGFNQQNVFRPTPPYRPQQIQFARINEPNTNRFHINTAEQGFNPSAVRMQGQMNQQRFPFDHQWNSYNPNLRPSMQGQFQQFDVTHPGHINPGMEGIQQHHVRPIKPKRQRKRKTSKVKISATKTESLPGINSSNIISNEFSDFFQPHHNPLPSPTSVKPFMDSNITNNPMHVNYGSVGEMNSNPGFSATSNAPVDGSMPNLVMPSNLRPSHLSPVCKGSTLKNPLGMTISISKPSSTIAHTHSVEQLDHAGKDSGRGVMTPPLPVLSPTLLLEEATGADDDDFSDFAGPVSAVFEFPVCTTGNVYTTISAPPPYPSTSNRKLSVEKTKPSTMSLTMTSSVDMKVASKVEVAQDDNMHNLSSTQSNTKTFNPHKKHIPVTHSGPRADNTHLVSSTGKVFQVPARKDQTSRRFSDDGSSDSIQTDPRKRIWSDPYPPYKPTSRCTDRKNHVLPFQCSNYKLFSPLTQTPSDSAKMKKPLPINSVIEVSRSITSQIITSSCSIPPYPIVTKTTTGKSSNITAEPYKLPTSIISSTHKLEFLSPKAISESPIPVFSSSAIPRILKPPIEAQKSSKMTTECPSTILKSHSVSTDLPGASKGLKLLADKTASNVSDNEIESEFKAVNVLATVSRITPSYIQKESESFAAEKQTKMGFSSSSSSTEIISQMTISSTSNTSDNKISEISSVTNVSDGNTNSTHCDKNDIMHSISADVPSSIRALYSVSVPEAKSQISSNNSEATDITIKSSEIIGDETVKSSEVIIKTSSTNENIIAVNKLESASNSESVTLTNYSLENSLHTSVVTAVAENPNSEVVIKSSPTSQTMIAVTDLESSSNSIFTKNSVENLPQTSIVNSVSETHSSEDNKSSENIVAVTKLESPATSESVTFTKHSVENPPKTSIVDSVSKTCSSEAIKSSKNIVAVTKLESSSCSENDIFTKYSVEKSPQTSSPVTSIAEILPIPDSVERISATPESCSIVSPSVPNIETENNRVSAIDENIDILNQSEKNRRTKSSKSDISHDSDDELRHEKGFDESKSEELPKERKIETEISKTTNIAENLPEEAGLANCNNIACSEKDNMDIDDNIQSNASCEVPQTEKNITEIQTSAEYQAETFASQNPSTEVEKFAEFETLKTDGRNSNKKLVTEIIDDVAPVSIQESKKCAKLPMHDEDKPIISEEDIVKTELVCEKPVVAISEVEENSSLTSSTDSQKPKSEMIVQSTITPIVNQESSIGDKCHQKPLENSENSKTQEDNKPKVVGTENEDINVEKIEDSSSKNVTDSINDTNLEIDDTLSESDNKIVPSIPIVEDTETRTAMSSMPNTNSEIVTENKDGEMIQDPEFVDVTASVSQTKYIMDDAMSEASNINVDAIIEPVHTLKSNLTETLKPEEDVVGCSNTTESSFQETEKMEDDLVTHTNDESVELEDTEIQTEISVLLDEATLSLTPAVNNEVEDNNEMQTVISNDGDSSTEVLETPQEDNTHSPDLVHSASKTQPESETLLCDDKKMEMHEVEEANLEPPTSQSTEPDSEQSIPKDQDSLKDLTKEFEGPKEVVVETKEEEKVEDNDRKSDLNLPTLKSVETTTSQSTVINISSQSSTVPNTEITSKIVEDPQRMTHNQLPTSLPSTATVGISPELTDTVIRQLSSYNTFLKNLLVSGVGPTKSAAVAQLASTDNKPDEQQMKMFSALFTNSMQMNMLQSNPSTLLNRSQSFPGPSRTEISSSQENADTKETPESISKSDLPNSADESEVSTDRKGVINDRPSTSSSAPMNQETKSEDQAPANDNNITSIISTEATNDMTNSRISNKPSTSQATMSLDADSSQTTLSNKKSPVMTSKQASPTCSHQGLQVPIVSSSVKSESQTTIGEKNLAVENIEKNNPESTVQDEVSTSNDVTDATNIEQSFDQPINTENVVVEKRRGRSRNAAPKRNMKRSAISDTSIEKPSKRQSTGSSTPVLSTLRPISRTTTEKSTRIVKIGDLVWGQMRGFPSWPGKIVKPSEVRGLLQRAPLSDGKVWVKWFGDHTFTQMNPADLRTMTEGLEAHHKSRKKGRTRHRKISIHLETAIQEAVDELEQQQELKQGGSKLIPLPSTSSHGVVQRQSLEAESGTSSPKPRRGRKRKT
ncbi:uncharacterized protein LOC120342480 isoform X2 [Styela clava]